MKKTLYISFTERPGAGNSTGSVINTTMDTIDSAFDSRYRCRVPVPLRTVCGPLTVMKSITRVSCHIDLPDLVPQLSVLVPLGLRTRTSLTLAVRVKTGLRMWMSPYTQTLVQVDTLVGVSVADLPVFGSVLDCPQHMTLLRRASIAHCSKIRLW